jgi:hypothetical protein
MLPFLWQSLLTLLLYIGLAIFYSLNCSRQFAIHEPVLWPTLLALAVLYIFMLRQVATGRVTTKNIIIAGIAVALAAMAIRPFHSTDVYGYINRGWQQAHYGLNPYVYTVDAIRHWRDDPMLTNHWVNNPSPYGFVYLLIARFLCWVAACFGAQDKGAILWWFKGSNALVHLATGFILWLGVRYWSKSASPSHEAAVTGIFESATIPQASKPEIQGGFCARILNFACPAEFQPRLALAAYLLNPLILLHGLTNAHNDLWMGFFLTVTGYCVMTGAWLWALPALMASVLVKYGSIVLAPLTILLIFRQKQGLRWFLGGLGLSLLLGLLSGLPYLGEWSQFHLKEIGRNALVSHSSLHSYWFAAWKMFAKILGHVTWNQRLAVREGLSKTLTGSFALFYLGLLVKRLRLREYPTQLWLQDAVLILIILITLISLKFYAWYIGIFFSLALLLPPEDWRRRFVLLLSLMQLMSLTIVGQSHMLNFLLMSAVPWGTVVLPGMGFKLGRLSLILFAVLVGGLLFAALLGLRSG